MSIARGIATSIVGPIAGGRGGVPYDADALDYFTRAEALGGSFDQTGINGTYTEAYIKTAISNFIAGCKTDSIWTKLTEVYLLTGVTFDGLMAKVKHAGTATLTNSNFVTGDYLAAGSGAGLKGNGSTKRLATGQNVNQNSGLFAYQTVKQTDTNVVLGGDAGFPNNIIDLRLSGAYAFRHDSTGVAAVTTGSAINSFIHGHRNSQTELKGWQNGSLIATTTTATATLTYATTSGVSVFARGNTGITDAKQSLAGISSGDWSDTDAANLSNRVNALMTALGANVY